LLGSDSDGTDAAEGKCDKCGRNEFEDVGQPIQHTTSADTIELTSVRVPGAHGLPD